MSRNQLLAPHSKPFPRVRIWLCLLAVLLLELVPGLFPTRLSACAMSALISMNGQALDEFPGIGKALDFRDYNDPWDYFGFVMANSTVGSNSDGYGVLAYSQEHNDFTRRQSWYKRVKKLADFGFTFYKGSYFEGGIIDEDRDEAFDQALQAVQSSTSHTGIVLCHARNATGATLGNHPFTFEYQGRTYSFMHNGYCNSARAFMINSIHEMHPGYNWFEQHPSNYFGDSEPSRWVDTEVLFHYIMSYIIARNGDTLGGMQRALAKIRSYLLQTNSGVFNFILSDGERLYVFRNSPTTGGYSSYKLSYKTFHDRFYGIRTQAPQEGDTELLPMELVLFSHDEEPVHYKDFPQDNFGDDPEPIVYLRNRLEDTLPALTISPNPTRGTSKLRVVLTEAGSVNTNIYNLKGEEVWHERVPHKPPGMVIVNWDGCDMNGRLLGAGIYFVRIDTGGSVRFGKIVRLR